MTKEEFLKELESKLSGLPKDEIKNRIDFYSEMIDDIIEEGKTEEEAIEKIGNVDSTIKQIASETSMVKLVKEKIMPKRPLRTIEIVLIILGAPLWVPLVLLTLFLVILAYLLIWLGVIICYSILLFSAYSFITEIINFFALDFSLFHISIAIISIGMGIFMYYGSLYATKGTILLSKKIGFSIKKSFITRG